MSQQKTNKILLVVGLLGLVALIILFVTLWPHITKRLPSFAKPVVSVAPGYYIVTEVYDGDTIAVNMDGRQEKVRMIGVDTPETHKPNSPVECGGPEASAYASAQLSGKQVRLEADPTNQNRDRYDRLLRYVYTSSGELFNKRLIETGNGFAYTLFPFEKKAEFIAAGQMAEQLKAGAWAFCQITNQNGQYKTKPL